MYLTAPLPRRCSPASGRSLCLLSARDEEEDPCIEEAGEQRSDVRAGQPIEATEAPGDQRRAADDQCRADDQAGGQAIDEDDGSGIVLQFHASEHEEHPSGEETEHCDLDAKQRGALPGISCRMPVTSGTTKS